MVVTNQKSTQLANADLTPRVNIRADENAGKQRIALFEHVQSGAGDAASDVELVKLPPGRVRVLLPLSRVAHSALGASRTLDLGWQAYTDIDGTAVAADPNGLDAAVDVSGAGNYNPVGTIGSHETKVFESKDGVTLIATVAGGTIPDAATLDGYIIYVKD